MKRLFCFLMCCFLIVISTSCGKAESPSIDTNKFNHDEEWLANLEKYSQETEPLLDDTQDIIVKTDTDEEPITIPPIEESTAPVETITEPPIVDPMEKGTGGFYYNLLSPMQQKYYDSLNELVQNGLEQLNVTDYLTEQDVRLIAKSLKADNPELFWVQNFIIYTRNATKNVTKVRAEYNDLVTQKDSIKTQIETISQYITDAVSGMTEFEKEKYIHDYLIDTCVYQSNDYDQTLYSALILKETVCAGYSKAFQYLCLQNGIEVYYVSGILAHNGTEDNHAWNLAKINNEYYAVDVTSDDSNFDLNDFTVYTYFNFNESKESIFQRDDFSKQLPKSNGSEPFFETVYGTDPETYALMKNFGITDIFNTLPDFKAYFIQKSREYGYGEFQLNYIIKGTPLLKSMEDWLSSGRYMDDFVNLAGVYHKTQIRFRYQLTYASFSDDVIAVLMTCWITE